MLYTESTGGTSPAVVPGVPDTSEVTRSASL